VIVDQIEGNVLIRDLSSSGGSGSAGNSVVGANAVPKKSEWNGDPNAWEKLLQFQSKMKTQTLKGRVN